MSGELYGRFPAMEVLEDIKYINNLSPEERAYAYARFVEWRLGYTEKDNG